MSLFNGRVLSSLHSRGVARVCVGVVAGALAISLVGPVGAQAAVTTGAAASVAPTVVSSAPDRYSAVVAATSQGSRVEILSEHTESQRVWANPDGSFTVDAYPGPQFVQQADGSWQDVNTALVAAADGKSVEPVTAAADITLANGATDPAGPAAATAATVVAPGDKASLTDGAASVASASGAAGAPASESVSGPSVSVSVGWNGDLPKPTLSDNVATYADVAPGQDLRIAAKPRGVEAFVDLTTKPAVVPDSGITVTLPLSTKGLTASSDGQGGYVLKDSAGQVVSDAPPALVWDATTDPVSGDPVHKVSLPTTVTTTSTGYALSVTVPASFLNDPTLQWPVTIDPTGTIYASADTYVEKGYNTTNFGTDDDLKVGTYDSGTHVARSFLLFPLTTTAGKSISGTKVTSAYLHLYEWWSASCTNRALDVKNLTTSFSESGSTWNSQPTIASTVYGTITDALGWSSSCPAGELGGSTGIAVTSLVAGWAAGTIANHGLALTASETDSLGWKRFYSSEHSSASARPYLTVTYNNYPSTPGTPSVTPSTAGWTNTSTPQLAASVTDPDLGSVFGRFKVYNGSTLVCTVDGTHVTAPGTSVVTPTVLGAGCSLAAGVAYTVKVTGEDGSLESKATSAAAAFTIDKTAPGAPTVTSSAYNLTAGAWTDPAPTSNTFTFAQPSGTTDVTSFQYSEDGGSWTTVAAASGSATLSWVAPQGVHSLAVRSVDHANNVSTTSTTVSFNVGPGGLTTPASNDRTQAYVSLTTDAPVTRSHITRYEYQVGNSTTAAAGTLGGWTTIPVTDLYTPGTTTNPTYPLPRSGATFPALDWNLAKTVTTAGGTDGLVQIRACLGTSATDPTPQCSLAVPVTLDATAFGGTYATSPLGPGTVSLTTGDWSTSDTDASFAGLSVSRSLTTLSPSTATGVTGGVFGPGWTASLPAPAGASDLVLADHFTQGYATLTGADGSQSTYVTTATTLPATFTGVGDAADGSVLKKVSTTSYTLTDPDGTITTWTLVGSAWQATSVAQPGNEATTAFTYEASNRVTRILAPVPTGVTCPATGALVAGCRALTITYAPTTTATGTTSGTWGDYAGQVSAIAYTSYDPATSAMATTTVASYLYDSTGHLRAQWDPRITPALKTTYDYNGNRLTTLTPPGQNAWTLDYDTTNRVVDAKRTDPANGTATTAVVYGIPISGTGAAIDLGAGGANDPATWGHATDLPRVGAAVFPASHVPGTPDANGDYTPASGDWPFADLSYQDVNGRTVTSASYGAGQWLISSQEYDATGNTVWSLDATSRAEALAPTAASDPYVQGLTTSAARAAALATTSTYDGAGNLKTSTGPVHDVVLAAYPTTEVPVRQVTTNTYDEGAPTGGPYYLVTTTTSAPTPVDGTAVAAADTKITKTSYNPIDGASTTGLTSGWVLRAPTKTTTVMGTTVGGPSGATDIVKAVLYDASGRVVQNRQPADTTGTTAGTRVTTYYTTAANATFPACGGHPEWAGMVCRTGQAAQPAGVTIPATVITYDRYDQPLTVVETSGTTTRTTTNAYDGSGRLASTKVSDNLAADIAVLEQDVDYDPATGAAIKTRSVSAGGTTVATVTTGYDAIGRVVTQDDGNGNTATTTYTIDGQPKTVTDNQATTTYSYDGTGEHRGLVTSIDAGIGSGVPSVTTAAYDRAGTPTITYPNGVVAARAIDTAGTLQSLTYTDSAGTKIAEWDQAFNAYGQVITSNGPSSSGGRGLTYTYDPAGRLTTASDLISTQCTVRGYGLDVDSNRTSQNTWVGADQAACPTSAATSASSTARTSTYDTYDRAAATTVTGTGAGTATYSYDTLGRATSVPQVDIAGSAAIATGLTYFANDLAATETQTGGTTRTFGLDALRRLNTWTDTSGTASTITTNHYDDTGDSPAWTSVNDGTTASTSRNIVGPDGNLALTTRLVGAGSVTASLNIVTPHGDIFTTIPDVANATAAQVGAGNDTDEFGVALTSSGPSYGWVGAKRRATDTLTGLIQMGLRLYNPATGRFLSIDPVFGGNPTAYAYPCDPIGSYDLDGRFGWDDTTNGMRAIWRSGPVQTVAHFAVNVVAVVPYAAYYGAYRVNVHIRWSQWMTDHLGFVRRVMSRVQRLGLSMDEHLDNWKRNHIRGTNEDTYDEHKHGSFCPSQIASHVGACRPGGRLWGWLPGSYRRNGRVYRDFAD